MATWGRQMVELLISLYEEKRCLYEIGSPEYHNKEKRNAALNEMAACLADLRPGTTPEDVKSKINGLRTQFMAERNKMKKGRKSGAGVDDLYKPTLWCFNSLQFLEKHSMPRQSVSNLEDGSSSSCESPVLLLGSYEDMGAVEESSPLTGNLSMSRVLNTPVGAARKGKKRVNDGGPELEDFLKKATNALEDSKRRHTSGEHFGLYIGMELDKLSNEVVRKKAMCSINNILLDAFLEDEGL